MGVTLRAVCRPAFGDNAVMRSVDLVSSLVADPERPWAEYNRGRAITQRQVAKLLGTFGIISVNVNPIGLPQGKGYRRVDFEESWERYCPGQIGSRTDSDISIRPWAGSISAMKRCKSGSLRLVPNCRSQCIRRSPRSSLRREPTT